jgi:Class II flagellar assembly regulator
MRVNGPNGTSVLQSSHPTRRAGTTSFTLATPDQAQGSKASAAAHNIGGIDALMALQGVDDIGERRKRAVRRGRHALDVLDALKIGLLSGTVDTAALARLKTAAADMKDASGDPGLDAVLAEISLRVEVELAKFGPPVPGNAGQ